MKKIPIIAFAPHPWEENQWMNRQHLLSRLAERGWQVFYCTGVLDWWARKTKGFEQAPIFTRFRSVDGVTLVDAGKVLPMWNKLPVLSNAAKYIYCNAIKKAAGLTDNKFIFMPFNPAFYDYMHYLTPCYTHFHAYDLYWKMENWDEEKTQRLILLNQAASLVTCSSNVLGNEMKGITGVEPKRLLNAADVEYFKKVQKVEPEELAGIPRPRVANIGAMNAKIDCQILAALATAMPMVSFVFVGRLEEQEFLSDPFNRESFIKLKSLPNVYFIAEKSRIDVPLYMYAMDILTVCYRTDAASWAYAGFPLKLVEYLATGKPVVASSIADIQNNFSSVVSICQNSDDWIVAINRLLVEDDVSEQSKRQRVAAKHSWEARVDQLTAYYEQMLIDS